MRFEMWKGARFGSYIDYHPGIGFRALKSLCENRPNRRSLHFAFGSGRDDNSLEGF